MITVDEIRRLEDLDSLRPVWHRLLRETPGATFFHTPEWLACYWRHYGAEQQLRVLVVQENGQPLGLLPLVVRTETTKVGSVRFLTYPLDYWGSFYSPIGPRGVETLRHGLAYLKNQRREWDVVELRWIDHDGLDAGHSAEVMTECEMSPLVYVRQEAALIDLAGTWADYMAGHTNKWRSNIRRWMRRLVEKGNLEYRRYRPAGTAAGEDDPRWDLYDACEAIARISWQGSSTDGTTLSHESVRPFLRDVHAVAAQTGCLDLNMLFLDGRPIAFAYNYWYQGYVVGLRIGYDPTIPGTSVGNMMHVHAIEDSFRRGDRVYDLGPGSLECKRDLVTRIQPVYFASHYEPWSVRGQLLRCKRVLDLQLAGCQASGPSVAPRVTLPAAGTETPSHA